MINGLKSKLPEKGGFVFNVLVLMTGTTIAQAIPIAISPILTRIYSPENFGVFALFISITSVLSVIATSRYELAIMLPEKDEDSMNVLVLSILITFGVSFLTLLIVSIFNSQITRLLNNQEISRWLYFIPLPVFFAGIYQSLRYWNTRKKQFKNLAISDVSQSGARGVTNLLLGFLKFGSAGLITGSLMGQGLAASILGWIFLKNDKDKKRFVSKDKIIYNAKRYKSFPKYQLVGALINSFELQLPIFAISFLFNNYFLGLYSFSLKLVSMPLSLIAMSISKVSYKKVVELIQTGSGLDKYIENITFRLTLLVLVIIGGVCLLAVFFSTIFGERWGYASNIIYVLVPMLFLRFISAPITMFAPLNRNDLFLKWQIAKLFLTSGAFLLSYFFKMSLIHTLAIYSFMMSISYIWTFYINFKLSNANFRSYLKLFIPRIKS